MINKISNFYYSTSAFKIIRSSIFFHLFLLLTRKSLPLFTRGKDIISVGPQLFGSHEPKITGLIGLIADSGYGDFLVDVGANIGLTSCQNGDSFKEVHMYEPNPLCCKILEVNSIIALESTKYHIHGFGLGQSQTSALLTVPRNNWGGAFLKDSGNAYCDLTLAHKDGYVTVDKKNYFEIGIEVRNATEEFESLFNSFKSKGYSHGVIKIDVEGYELTILSAIAKTLPNDICLCILFEQWDPQFPLDSVIKLFERAVLPFKLVEYLPYRRSWTRLLKLICLLFNWSVKTKLEKVKGGTEIGDIVLIIN